MGTMPQLPSFLASLLADRYFPLSRSLLVDTPCMIPGTSTWYARSCVISYVYPGAERCLRFFGGALVIGDGRAKNWKPSIYLGSQRDV